MVLGRALCTEMPFPITAEEPYEGRPLADRAGSHLASFSPLGSAGMGEFSRTYFDFLCLIVPTGMIVDSLTFCPSTNFRTILHTIPLISEAGAGTGRVHLPP